MNVKAYGKLIRRYSEIVRLGQIGSLLLWDQNTYMPPGAARMRGEQESLISGLAHKQLTSKTMGRLLKETRTEDLTDGESASVREIERSHTRAISIPNNLVKEISKLEPTATRSWIKARDRSDFSLFSDDLERFLSLKKKLAEHVGYEDTPYDALMDEYEPYMKSRQIESIFQDLGEKLKPLVSRLTDVCSELDPKSIAGDYPIEKQRKFFHMILERMGYDFDRGRMDTTAHPFTSGYLDDVRITLRFDENDIRPGLFSAIHEGGHALYEQGFLEENHMTPLAEAISLGIHESQSRLWENIVGRSLPFWKSLYPELRSEFDCLRKTDIGVFHKAINHVARSPIRVEADEVTYSMHILVRFLIEKDLVEEKMEVREIPQVWNELYRKYLGFVPENDADGCLQDIHWAMGVFGYFPTYTLGNLYSAQFYDSARKDIDDLEGSMENGDLGKLLGWLRTNIHHLGKFHSADDLIKEVTGHKLTGDHFIDYLKDKYSKTFDIAL